MRVPEGWKVKTISNILDKVSRPVEVAEKDLYREIGIRSHGKGIFYKEPISGAQLGKKRVFHIEPNCLVINIVFAWEQAVAKTTDAEIGMIASHRFPMFAPMLWLVQNLAVVLPGYCHRILKSHQSCSNARTVCRNQRYIRRKERW